MSIKRKFFFPLGIALAVFFLLQVIAVAQKQSGEPQTVTLLARKITDGGDNYSEAAFSFKFGVNGEASLQLTYNNWDLLFGNSYSRDAALKDAPSLDTFDVYIGKSDRSRIKDLGEYTWSDSFQAPVLPPYEVQTREPGVKAIVGHMYIVHTKDRRSDHYALFRVESLEPGKRVTISWKLIPAPK